MSINEITLERKSAICPEFLSQSNQLDIDKIKEIHPEFKFIKDSEVGTFLATSATANMSQLGYLPSEKLFKEMSESPVLCEQINKEIIPVLEEIKGADIDYIPMYPNFPQEVMQSSEARLFVNAMVHYWSNGQLVPDIAKEERAALDESIKYQTVDSLTNEECKKMFTQILNSSVPYSAQDKNDIDELSKTFSLKENLPAGMINKENVAYITNFGLKTGLPIETFSKYYKTPTDVLRLMNYEHGTGDLTLSSFKLGQISRADRKKYLSLIENTKDIASEMKINKNRWKYVGEKLHPGEFAKRFPKTFEAFSLMRDKQQVKNVKTFNARAMQAIEAIKDGNIKSLHELAENQSGVFLRNVEQFVRNSFSSNFDKEIIEALKTAATKASPELLWEVYGHFDRELKHSISTEENKLRIFPTRKGGLPYIKTQLDTRPPMKSEMCEEVKKAIVDGLKERYKNKPEMGKVYIDETIRECKIPNTTRDINISSKPTTPGSRFAIGDKNIVRGFIWWTNGPNNERTDIDLSAVMLDKNLECIDRIAYYNLSEDWGCHSGDIVNGNDFNSSGVAEFVDVDLAQAKEAGGKYIAFCVNSFSLQPFSETEHIRFGYMEREKVQSGEVFEPSTVEQYVKLNAPSRDDTVCLFDVETREMIWVDTPGIANFNSGINNVDTQMQGITASVYRAIHSEKPSIIDVIKANVEARGGEFVDSPEEADLIFGLNDGIRPTDLAYFSGELIPDQIPDMASPEINLTQENRNDIDFEFNEI